MSDSMKRLCLWYGVIFLLLSTFTIGAVISTIVLPNALSSAVLGTMAFHTEPTHGIILALVVRQLVESAKAGTLDIGQVTQLSKKKPATQNKDNIYSVVNPETIIANSKLGSNMLDSTVEN